MESFLRRVEAREPSLDSVRSGKPLLLVETRQPRLGLIPLCCPHPRARDSPGLARWVQGEALHIPAESSGLGHWPRGLCLLAPDGKATHVPRGGGKTKRGSGARCSQG